MAHFHSADGRRGQIENGLVRWMTVQGREFVPARLEIPPVRH